MLSPHRCCRTHSKCWLPCFYQARSPSIIRKVILGASHPRLFFLHSISPHTSPKKTWRDRWTLFPHGLCLGKVQLLQRGSHLSSLPELPSTHGEWGMPHGSATGCQQSEDFREHKAYIYIYLYRIKSICSLDTPPKFNIGRYSWMVVGR